MIALVMYTALFLIILGLLYTLAYWIKEEVTRQIEQQSDLELERIRAIHAIKDEMRASSHRLLAAAIDPESGRFDVVDASDLEDRESD